MRKLKLQVQMTVDGFVASPNGEMDWSGVDWDAELIQYTKDITEPVDLMLLGRKLAEGFIPYWASAPAGEDPWGVNKQNSTPKVVFSDTLTQIDWPNTVLATGDLVDEVNRLKNQPGQDIIAYGGALFVSALIQHDLIDEYHLYVNSAAIGSGLAIFNRLDGTRNLTLKQARGFSCGIAVLFYVPKR